VSPLFVDYQQPARNRERRAAAALADHYGLTLNELACAPLVIPSAGLIPGRNGLLLFAAAVWSQQRSVVLGIGLHAGTPYGDSSEDFLNGIDVLVAASSQDRQRVDAPFIRWSKGQVWRYALDSMVPIELTYSCETSEEPCGSCSSCRDRIALHATAS
jgi:7-cyano-7-deazaguanine synthase